MNKCKCWELCDCDGWSDRMADHADFDIPILANAYRVLGQRLPFHYRYIRDIRTLVDLSKLPYNKPDKPKDHNALNDCLYQVKYCVECFNTLKRDK